MVLSVGQANEHLIHAIGGPLVSISNQRVLDEAGHRLYKKRPWTFLQKIDTTLGFTNGQSYIALESDFGGIISLDYKLDTLYVVKQTTINDIMRMRKVNAPPFACTFAAIGYADDSRGIPTPRLEIYPTPTATVANAIAMVYTRRWEALTGDGNSYITGIPEWCEDLYIALVRAVATSYQKKTFDAEIDAVWATSTYLDAVKFDSGQQAEFGPLQGGALEMSNNDGDWTSSLVLPAAPPTPV